jgi:hypothetical protein
MFVGLHLSNSRTLIRMLVQIVPIVQAVQAVYTSLLNPPLQSRGRTEVGVERSEAIELFERFEPFSPSAPATALVTNKNPN